MKSMIYPKNVNFLRKDIFTMNIYFDTEFTGLHKDTTLISIGLVDEEDRLFYAEFTDYNKDQVDDWIRKNVINNLQLPDESPSTVFTHNSNNEWFIRSDKSTISSALNTWLLPYENITFVSDVCNYDSVLLTDLITNGGTASDMPKKISPVVYDINYDIAKYYKVPITEAFDMSREDIIANFHISGIKHNALYDAKVIKTIYNFIKAYESISNYIKLK